MAVALQQTTAQILKTNALVEKKSFKVDDNVLKSVVREWVLSPLFINNMSAACKKTIVLAYCRKVIMKYMYL